MLGEMGFLSLMLLPSVDIMVAAGGINLYV
jgi:hypothetical protein